MLHVAPEIVAAIREGTTLPNAKLDALSNLTREIVRERGHVSPETIQAFLDAGYQKNQVMELLVGPWRSRPSPTTSTPSIPPKSTRPSLPKPEGALRPAPQLYISLIQIMNTTKARTTTQEMDAAREHYRTQVIPAEKLRVMDADTARLDAEGINERIQALVGQTAQDFILMDTRGEAVRLYDLLEHGPVVLVFYRGGWCPYCNLHLRGFQRVLPQVLELGASLVAISPQLPDNSLSTEEKNALEYPLLSDVGNTVARRFGLAFRLSPELLATYEAFGHGLEQMNGEEGAQELPVPTTIIIGTDRKIVQAAGEVDYTHRLDPQDALATLRTLPAARTPAIA